VVDDNSDENIIEFNELIKLKNDYTEIYLTKEGKGAGYARNIGLKYAKGQWLLFADADDPFTENAFDCFFAYADSPEEIIFFKSTSCYSDTGIPANWSDHKNNWINDYIKKEENREDYLRYFWGVPWAKMIKKELVDRESITFNEIRFTNDVMFSYMTGHYASSIKVSDYIVYTVTVSKGSLSNVRNFEASKIRYTEKLRRNLFLRKVGKKHIQMSMFNQLIRVLLEFGPLPFFELVKMHFSLHDYSFLYISIFNSFKSLTSFLKKIIKRERYSTKSYKGAT
jgi:glycosyltransferase involved in cell wall biosynthesis